MNTPRWLLLGALVGCTRAIDPCPTHMISREGEDRCVPLDGGEDAATDAAHAEPPESEDAGASDASTPEPALDASDSPLDGSQTEPDAASDAGTARDAAVDASIDSGDAAIACSAEDHDLWRELHLSDHLVEHIKDCVASNPGCAFGLSCALDQCLREAAGVMGCDTCIEAEVRCVADHCVAACGAASDDARCRACACNEGCVGEYDSCAGEALDVCADCDGETCWNMSLLPELIMVVLSPVLH